MAEHEVGSPGMGMQGLCRAGLNLIDESGYR